MKTFILIALASLGLVACAPLGQTGATTPETAANNRCRLGESELACISRENAELRTENRELGGRVQQAFNLIRQGGGGQTAPAAGPTPQAAPPSDGNPTGRAETDTLTPFGMDQPGSIARLPNEAPAAFDQGPGFQPPMVQSFPQTPSGAIWHTGFTGPNSLPQDVPKIAIFLDFVGADVAIDVDGQSIRITEDGGRTFPSIPLRRGGRRFVSPYATHDHSSRMVVIALENPDEGGTIRLRAYRSNSVRPLGTCIGQVERVRSTRNLMPVLAVNGYSFTSRCVD